MVQLSYFGDSRDYFKYDLITTFFEESGLRRYVFVPMLTLPRINNEGKIRPEEGKSKELLEFIRRVAHNKSLKHWRTWLESRAESYQTIEPADSVFFKDISREQYWKRFETILSEEKALVFVDPDTGLQTGSVAYRKKHGAEKYLLNTELELLLTGLHTTSVLMVYQHLTRDKNKQQEGVNKKLAQVRKAYPSIYACAHREGDLAFLFLAKSKRLIDEVFHVLDSYHERCTHHYKSLHKHA